MVDADGRVTEGSSTNAWIVTKEGRLITRNANQAILNGITRLALIDVAGAQEVVLEERAFTLEEALEAKEAFLTSSTNLVMPVTRIDGKPVGNGHPGIVTMRLRDGYFDHIQSLEGAA